MQKLFFSRLISLASFTATFALMATCFTLSQARDNFLNPPGQVAVNLKYTGITYHPGGGENLDSYKRALDDEDYWVLLVGGQADIDYLLSPFLYLRASTSFYRDCADLWAGYYHLGFRANWDATEKLSLRIGIGPTYLWRENWFGKVRGYTKDSFFGPATQDKYQGAFLWYGGDAEVEWKVAPRISALYSLIPGYPEVIQNSIGLRYSFL